ncbi:MAG: hypothetical protein KDA85_02990 [Planctomycetaceae bacterium]|nr:hypothetical protein [Planctomycetaceae bacterium]
MRTLGVVLLVINILCLLAGGVLMARVGKHRNDVSVALADARQKSEKAVADYNSAKLDLLAAESELARVKLGWDREWEQSPQQNNNLQVGVQGVNLLLNGLGSANGLAAHETPQGAQVPPTVHVFALRPDQSSFYIGEFVADLAQLQPNAAVLRPNWNVPQSELRTWDFSQGFRLRTLIPRADRARVDHLNTLIQETVEQIGVLDRKIVAQTALNDAARAQLEVRRGELLGNPNHPEVEGRPEFTAGLLAALRDLEDDRNSIQASVDTLRRMIKRISDLRIAILDEIIQLAGQLPVPATQISRNPN